MDFAAGATFSFSNLIFAAASSDNLGTVAVSVLAQSGTTKRFLVPALFVATALNDDPPPEPDPPKPAAGLELPAAATSLASLTLAVAQSDD